jgi:hypothetical protein
MADASANARAIAVGFGRRSERDPFLISLRFAPPANELRAQRPGVLTSEARGPPPVLLLVCGVLGFVHAAPGQRPPEAVPSVAARAADWRRSLTTSPREIRSNLRGILLMAPDR